MHVAFLYNRSADDPAGAAEDEFPARSPVVAALKRLGHKVTPIACSLDLAKVREQLQRVKPDVVFNRVESLGGSDGMMAALTLLLDTMQIPYTGNSTAALVATASKLTVKQRLVEAGLPTPAWMAVDCGLRIADCGLKKDVFSPQSAIRNPKFILKSVFEHASFEIDDSSVMAATSEDQIRHLINERECTTGRRYFAEAFIEGREFNVSVIGEPPMVLPLAEIDFSAFPEGKPRIVGHIAKWDESSFEYNTTERIFEFPEHDRDLLVQLHELTVACWQLFGLTGYARVDFRCDTEGRPWILEINTNPCIAPEAGFATALEYAGIGYDVGLQRILDDAVERGTVPQPTQRVGNQAALHV